MVSNRKKSTASFRSNQTLFIDINAPYSDAGLPATQTIQFQSTTASVAEGANIDIPIILDNPVSGGTSVSWAVTGGTAIPADYDLTGAASWPDGVSGTVNINLAALADVFLEPDETVEITLSSPTNGAILGANTVMTVTITDSAPSTAAEFTTGVLAEFESGVIAEF